MKKTFTIFTLTVVILVSSLAVGLHPSPARAQSDPLICDSFTGSSNDVRVSYYMGEGIGYFASGNLSRALDSFSCVTDQIDPGFLPAFMSRAAVYAEYRSYEESIEDYNAALALNSSFAAAYNNRGIVYAAQQEYDLALEDFSHVISLDANMILAYNNRAVIYTLTGQYEQAIADLQQAITLSGISGTLAQLRDPDRDPEEPWPVIDRADAQSYALLGIIYELYAQSNYNDYLYLMRGNGDRRIESAAGALESRFSFDLRLDDGTWLFSASFSPAG
ncbi:MAG: tetratricopeptide repeat protein [Chloroflexi bacterium]|nr:tetratricopeptide repeat protein [Chloroflexota bacterium]